MTVFAGDNELLAFLHHEPHGRIIMTEIIVKPRAGSHDPENSVREPLLLQGWLVMKLSCASR